MLAQAQEFTLAKSEQLIRVMLLHWEGEGFARPLQQIDDHYTAVELKENQNFTLSNQFKTDTSKIERINLNLCSICFSVLYVRN